MNRFALFASTCLMIAPSVALAQGRTPMPATDQAPAASTASTPAVGAAVFDSAGVQIGTIDSITPQAIVLAVGATKIAVPPTAIGASPKGLAMAMTKADLEAAQAQQQAQAQTAVKSRLVAGTAVNGLGGAQLGTIKSATDQAVTLTTPKGDVQLPVSGFTADATGKVVVGLTQAQLDTAMAGAGAATTGTAAAAGSSTTGTTTAGTTPTGASTTTTAGESTPAATTTTTTAKATTTKTKRKSRK